MAISAESRKDIIELVVVGLNQAPGTTLLTELVAIVDGGGTLADVAANLTASASWKAKFPAFQTAEEFADEWLAGLIPEASAETLASAKTVVVGLVNGGSSFADILIEAQAFLSATAESDTSYGTSVANFNNKTEVATYHTVTAETADPDTTLLATVTSDDATVTTANTSVDTTNSAAAATTISLTTGLDTGAAFTGAAGNDIFVSVDNNVATTGTLTAGDNLDGGAGSDTLKVVASGTPSAPLVSTTSIETLDLTNNSGAGYSFNASLMPGLSTVNVTGGNEATTVTNSQGNLSIVASTTNNDITTTSATPSLGAADSIDVSLTSVGTTTNTTFTSNGIETMNVTLTGAASGSTTVGSERTVTLVSDQLETVNITGSVAANLVVDLDGADAFNQVGTVDASGASGGVTISVTAGDSSDKKTTVSMGAGDDKVTIGALDKDYTVTGGAGSDTLVATASAPSTSLAAADYVGVGVSGFETISADSAGTVDFRSLANNTTFIATTGAGTYSKAGAGIADSYLTATSGTLTLTRATDTSADALNVHITPATAATVSASVVDEETVTVAAAGTGSGITHNLTLTVADATKLSVIGSNGLNISSLVGETSLATIDAGSNTGPAFTVNASDSTAAMTVTGSAGVQASTGATVNTITTGTGADTVTGGEYADTITTGLGNDSVVGGGGNDTITTGGGNDTVTGGAGNDTITSGSGDDNLTGGDGADNIDAGSGADTVDGGAGNDRVVITLSDSTSVDGGTGTDRVSASTASVTSTTAATVTAQFIAVADDVAPTLTGVEELHVRVDADAGTTVGDPVELDLTNASSLTTLFMDTDDAASDAFMKVKNFAGSALTVYGGANFGSGAEADNITLDGVGQSAVTMNLQAFEQAAASTLTVTGIQGLTISPDSTSQLTGSADQDNTLGVVTANSVTSLTVASNGSAATNAAAFTAASFSATAANTLSVTTGTFDDFEITGDITAGTAVENATITVGTDSQFTMAQLDMSTSAVSSVNITVNSGGFASNSNGNTTVATAEGIDIIATSIADLNITMEPASNASLILTSVALTDADITLGSSSVLTLEEDIGVAGSASNLTVSGRGDLDSDDVGSGGLENAFVLAGSSFTWNTSGLTVDSDNLTITATGGADSITTGLGADTIAGGAGNDTITGGAAADSITGGDGADSVVLTESTSAADTVVINAVVGTSAESNSVTNTGNDNNTGEDTITGFTLGTDTIQIVATSAVSFVHATDTAIGTADAGAAATGIAGDYLATSGLIDLDNDAVFSGVDDIVVNFSSPSATLTETNFEAALQYNLSLAAGGQTVVTGGLADTVTGGTGADNITTGAGADTISLGVDGAIDTINIEANGIGTATAAQGAVSVDTIGDFLQGASKDILSISIAALEGLTGVTDLVLVGNASTSVSAGAGVVLADGDTATDLATGATASVLLVQGAAALTEDAIETALEVGGSNAITANNAFAVGDAFLAQADNGTDGALFLVLVGGNGIANDETAAGTELTAIKLLTLTGLSTAESSVADNFVFVA